MITLEHDALSFRCPEVHPRARCRISFQRTLRLPDDGDTYPLPPGLGRFPIAHVDDHAARLPSGWQAHGGVFLPMFQAEALWIAFDGEYPFAVKVATGKINAVSGAPWCNELLPGDDLGGADYLVLPEQPWLDGFNVGDGIVRQFVAMPLGEGFTAEEQLTGAAEHGGLQLLACPMKREVYEAIQAAKTARRRHLDELHPELDLHLAEMSASLAAHEDAASMGLAPGGRMRQQIYDDPHGIAVWDVERASRCFVHLLNSETYEAATGEPPPTRPPGPKDYARAGLPWFDYYAERPTVEGSARLRGLLGVGSLSIEKGRPLPGGNDSVDGLAPVRLGPGDRVREGEF